MKKVAVIWSSPNTDGLTASAKDQFLNGLKEAGAEVEEIHLNSKHLEHCRACGNGWGTCNKTGSCVYDRISLVRYNKDYLLPTLSEAGKTYAKTLETGFDMYY